MNFIFRENSHFWTGGQGAGKKRELYGFIDGDTIFLFRKGH